MFVESRRHESGWVCANRNSNSEPSQDPVNVTLELRRLEDGSMVWSPSSIVISANGQVSRFLGELFPNLRHHFGVLYESFPIDGRCRRP